MDSDEYGGWQEPPRGRREPARYDPEAEYERALRERAAGRDAGDWTADQAWPADPATYPAADPYRSENGYQASDWPSEPDPYGRTDPRASLTDPRASMTDPRASMTDPRASMTDPRASMTDPRASMTDPRAAGYDQQSVGYASTDPRRADRDPRAAGRAPQDASYGSRDAGYGPGDAAYDPRDAAYGSRAAGYGPGDAAYDPRDGRLDPRGTGYYDEPPYAGRGEYAAPPAPRDPAGYGQGGYGPSYDTPSHPDQAGYGSRGGYDGREPYVDPASPVEPDTFGGRDGYRPQAGYGAGGYEADDRYRQVPEPVQPDYDSYGRPARSGPMPAYDGDDAYDHVEGDQGWQAQGGRTSATGGRGGEYGRPSGRPGRRAPAYQQEDVGHDGPPGGSRMSGADMDADDGRHDGFFSGYGGTNDDHDGGGSGGRGPRRKRGRGRAAGMIALVVVVVLLCGAGGVAYHFYSKYKSSHASYTGNGYGSVTVTVPAGATAVSLAPELVAKGVIASSDTFVSYVDTSSNPTGLQPGEFRLHEHMGNAQAWAMLLNPKSSLDSSVTIPDGLPVKQILPLLAKKSGIPLSKFQAAIKDTSALGLPSWAKGNPEGFLYPDTYDIVPGSTTALQILQEAVQQFNKEAGQLNLASAAHTAEFTELQVITEASLLEGEVGPKYYKDVARTLDNRLAIKMPLQLDSTVSYATGDYTYNLSTAQLHFPSPYNTFLHTDLPPGPINSPDAEAIQAVLHPAPSSDNWIYFCTVNKAGLTNFTTSYSTFQQWQIEAQHNGV
jgi:uncharacterized YceG family protein